MLWLLLVHRSHFQYSFQPGLASREIDRAPLRPGRDARRITSEPCAQCRYRDESLRQPRSHRGHRPPRQDRKRWARQMDCFAPPDAVQRTPDPPGPFLTADCRVASAVVRMTAPAPLPVETL